MRIITNLIVIACLFLFFCIIVSLLIRDAKNKKIKDAVMSDGHDVVGVITNVRSRSGGNSGFINITVQFDYTTKEGREMKGEADAVIDAINTSKYQPGEKLPLRYSRKDPQKVLVDIPRPVLKRE